MFRIKRHDTLVSTIETQYGIDLNVRSDALLGNLLKERGFDSLTQLVNAYHMKLSHHPRRRRIFLSFHAEDRKQVQGFRLMASNPNVDLDIYDASVRVPINSENARYIRAQIKYKIQRCSVLLCLIGNGTAWREWVDWEIRTAYEMGKGVCGIKLKDSRAQIPPALLKRGAVVISWSEPEQIIALIECAAARRS